MTPEQISSLASLRNYAKESLLTSATTVYEGCILTSVKMSGFQKVTFMAGLALDWKSTTQSTEPAVKYLHPALAALLPKAPPVKKSKKDAVGAVPESDE